RACELQYVIVIVTIDRSLPSLTHLFAAATEQRISRAQHRLDALVVRHTRHSTRLAQSSRYTNTHTHEHTHIHVHTVPTSIPSAISTYASAHSTCVSAPTAIDTVQRCQHAPAFAPAFLPLTWLAHKDAVRADALDECRDHEIQ